MRFLTRLTLAGFLLAALLVSSHSVPVIAQTEEETEPEAPATFIPSEKLPADSAVAFPVDI